MKSTLVAVMIVAITGASYAALAADDKAAPAKGATAEPSQKADTPQNPATAKKKMASHSHTQEKSGVAPAPATMAKSDADKTQEAMAKKNAHSHPKDAK